MDGKAILADTGKLAQSRCNHPPADSTLKAAQRQKAKHPVFKTAVQASGKPEEGKWNCNQKTHEAREHAMRPFPPEDGLECFERHALIDLLILRNLAVLIELFQPFGMVEWRNNTMDRFPFSDRQARACHARRATDHDNSDQNDKTA